MEINNLTQLDLNGTYTYADYLLWKIEERLEILRGKVFAMSPAPNLKHQMVSRDLFWQMGAVFKQNRCQLFYAPFDVRLPNKNRSAKDKKIYTVVQPDICVICDPEKLDEKGCIGPPDLVVEILSPGNTKKEMTAKYEIYEESGVREYWLVQPNDEVVFVYYLNAEGKYIGKQPAINTVQSHIFPELIINLTEIFTK